MEIIYDDRGNILEGVVIKYYSDDKKMSETPYKNGKIKTNRKKAKINF